MAKLFLWIVIFVIFLSAALSAQVKNFGAGIVLGDPTGISAKAWLSKTTAIDAAVGFSLGKSDRLHLHATYLFHNFNLIKSSETIPVYFGIGARLRASDGESGLGVRGVAGIAWHSSKIPIDVFFELAPVFNLFPSAYLDLDAGVGARYYF